MEVNGHESQDRYSDPAGSSPQADAFEGMGSACQICGELPASVQRYMFVMSFLVFTRHLEYEAQVCRRCSTRTGLREQLKSALLGWWGVPWGLLTFKAIWLNARSLLRWSTLSPVVALSVGVLGLAAPVTVGVAIYAEARERGAAEATGDWLEERTVGLVESGKLKMEQGDYEGAALLYEKAWKSAPDSSVVNFSLAQAYYALGRPEMAEPFAARSVELAPDHIDNLSLHCLILLALERAGSAETCLERLRAHDPRDANEASWMVDVFDLASEDEQMLRVAEAGLEHDPGELYLATLRIDALLGLDRVEEAGQGLQALREEGGEELVPPFLELVYRMRTEPESATSDLLELWMFGIPGPAGAEDLAAAAERSGQGESVRAAVHEWLFDAETDGDAWYLARPWFPDEEWIPSLDRYLNARPEVLPGLMRLDAMEPLHDAEKMVDLARRLAGSDHPLIQNVDGILLGHGYVKLSPAERVAEAERHIEAFPLHEDCLFRLAILQSEIDPSASRETLARIREVTGERGPLATAARVVAAELDLAEGQSAKALAFLTRVDRRSAVPYFGPAEIDLMIAEAGLHAGDELALSEGLSRLADAEEPRERAPGLLLRWSRQLARGEPPTYRADLDGWLARAGEDPRTLRSATAQAILLLEGLTDRQSSRRVMGRDRPEMVALVALVRDVAEAGVDPSAELGRIGEADARYGFAPRLARTILLRRGS